MFFLHFLLLISNNVFSNLAEISLTPKILKTWIKSSLTILVSNVDKFSFASLSSHLNLENSIITLGALFLFCTFFYHISDFLQIGSPCLNAVQY